jgi:hypothetical protein
VSSIGLLIASIVMLRRMFNKPAACVGIVASIAGLLDGFYFVVPALSLLLTPSLVAFGLWSILTGLRLNQLGKSA